MSIKYLLIGNPDDREEIGHYPDRGASKTTAKEADKIFKKLAESGIQTKDLRNKVDNRGQGYYYFTINSKNIFFLILGDKNLKERDAFGLMDDIQNENVPSMIESKSGKLNAQGREKLKEMVEDFEKNKSNRIQGLQNEVEEVKVTMKQNIQNMYNNVEDVKIMEEKANDLRAGAEQYNSNAVKLKRTTWCQNCKWWIILIVVIVLFLVILFPVIFSKK